MASRRKRHDPAPDELRGLLGARLLDKLHHASETRVSNASGTGFFASEADHLRSKIEILRSGWPLTLYAWELPEPWCSEWRNTRVRVLPGGTVVRDVK